MLCYAVLWAHCAGTCVYVCMLIPYSFYLSVTLRSLHFNTTCSSGRESHLGDQQQVQGWFCKMAVQASFITLSHCSPSGSVQNTDSIRNAVSCQLSVEFADQHCPTRPERLTDTNHTKNKAQSTRQHNAGMR